MGYNIPTKRIKTCRKISKNNPTVIVKFSRRKDYEQVWDVKKDLRTIRLENIDFPGQNKQFINKSLCPYYKVIWEKSKKLHSLGKIHNFFYFE